MSDWDLDGLPLGTIDPADPTARPDPRAWSKVSAPDPAGREAYEFMVRDDATGGWYLPSAHPPRPGVPQPPGTSRPVPSEWSVPWRTVSLAPRSGSR